jgi:hypothetical protein
MNRLGEVISKLDGRNGAIVDDLRAFLTEVLGKEGQEDATLHHLWLALQAELARVNSLRPALDEIARVSTMGIAKKRVSPKFAATPPSHTMAARIRVVTT